MWTSVSPWKAASTAAAYAGHAEKTETKRNVERRELQIELAIAEKDRLGAGAYTPSHSISAHLELFRPPNKPT
jgi:hypothetical protein